MKINLVRSLAAKVLAPMIVAFGVASGPAAAAEPIKMAVTNWANVLAVANTAKYVLETQLKQPVQFVQADGIQFQGVALDKILARVEGRG